MSAEMSGEQMQAKIAAARRDAEGLKDKIKRKKDELADTSCKLLPPVIASPCALPLNYFPITDDRFCSTICCLQQYGPTAKGWYESSQGAQRTFSKDICHALVHGSQTPCLGITRWKVNNMGCLYHKQSPRHTLAIFLGDDMRLRAQR